MPVAAKMALHTAGIDGGRTVLVMMQDVIEFVAVWAAMCKTGGIEVPVNTAYRGDILVHVANDSRAETFILDGRFLEQWRRDRALRCFDSAMLA